MIRSSTSTTRTPSPLPSLAHDEESTSHYFEAMDPSMMEEWCCHGTKTAPVSSFAWSRLGRPVLFLVVATSLLLASFWGGASVAKHYGDQQMAVALGDDVPEASFLLAPSYLFSPSPLDASLLERIQSLTKDLQFTQLTLQSYLTQQQQQLHGDDNDARGTTAHELDETGGQQQSWREHALQQEHNLQQRVRAMAFAKYNHLGGSESQPSQSSVLVDIVLQTSRDSTEHFVARVDTAAESFAAYYFLEQVQYGLWNGASFQVNAPSIMAARLNATSDALDGLGLSQLPRADDYYYFARETHEILRHDEYTLCFAPSGDARVFYINKQADMARTEETCFARVEQGFDVLNAVFQTKTSPPQYVLEQPIVIVEMRIVKGDEVDGTVESVVTE